MMKEDDKTKLKGKIKNKTDVKNKVDMLDDIEGEWAIDPPNLMKWQLLLVDKWRKMVWEKVD